MNTGWMQQSLTPPAALELRIRLGLVPERDHAQVMVELLDPTTGVLLAQWSRPHRDGASWHSMLDEAVQKGHQYVGDAIDPF